MKDIEKAFYNDKQWVRIQVMTNPLQCFELIAKEMSFSSEFFVGGLDLGSILIYFMQIIIMHKDGEVFHTVSVIMYEEKKNWIFDPWCIFLIIQIDYSTLGSKLKSRWTCRLLSPCEQ